MTHSIPAAGSTPDTKQANEIAFDGFDWLGRLSQSTSASQRAGCQPLDPEPYTLNPRPAQLAAKSATWYLIQPSWSAQGAPRTPSKPTRSLSAMSTGWVDPAPLDEGASRSCSKPTRSISTMSTGWADPETEVGIVQRQPLSQGASRTPSSKSTRSPSTVSTGWVDPAPLDQGASRTPSKPTRSRSTISTGWADPETEVGIVQRQPLSQGASWTPSSKSSISPSTVSTGWADPAQGQPLHKGSSRTPSTSSRSLVGGTPFPQECLGLGAWDLGRRGVGA